MLLALQQFIWRYKKFFKFCAVGASGAAIDFGLLALLVEVGGWPVLVANIVSFSVALVNNFLLNKFWAWRDTNQDYHRQFIKFTLTSLAGLAINTLLMWLFLALGMHYLVAKIFISAVVAVWNFSVNNWWTFKA